MAGFFKSEETQSDTLTERKCGRECKLCHNTSFKYQEPTGDGDREILIVGESPLQDEVKRHLEQTLRKYNIDLENDCTFINAVQCETNETPTDDEIAVCNHRVQRWIKDNKPRLIIPMGSCAIKAIIKPVNQRNDKGFHSALWRGWQIPDRTYKCWICPTFNPLEFNHKNKVFELLFKKDIKSAVKLLDNDYPEQLSEEKKVVILTDPKEIIKALRRILKNTDIIAFDYETTGKKPDAEGHDIICASIATSSDSAIAFPMYEKVRKMFCKILLEPEIKKIAQNLKYEETWSRIILNCKVASWYHDTMLTAHFIDNRKSITGLKFQVYINFGIADYDSEISPFLKSKESANKLNRIREAPLMKLLLYVGMDSLLTKRLAEKQIKEINNVR